MTETTTVAILFTDLEGSTDKWSRYGEAMARSLELHDDLAATVFQSHRALATEHTGDGAMAVFPAVGDAIAASRALADGMASIDWPIGEPLRLRMGIHVGPAQHRDGNYFGTAVSRAARIADAANAGQVLLSTAAHLAARDLLPGHDAADVGPVSLKGLEGHEVVYHLNGAPFGSPSSPRTAPAGTSALPRSPTALVGRSHEVQQVSDLLADHRMVTLTGVGGVGKTRLALAVAATPNTDAVFVDLAPVGPDEVTAAFCAGVGVSPMQQASLASLVAALADRPVLLVVDNCEHLLDEVADVLDPLIATTSGTRVLATSREPIGSVGERVYRVPFLPVNESVELFVERAAAAGHVVDDREKAGEICRRLDGIPLAIELAAARTTHLGLDQLAERLDERFRILTGGRRGAERQRTLEAVMSWSYDLLSSADQRALRMASSFVGSFHLEAFAAVADLDAADALDRIGSLVDKSLLSTEADESGRMRYSALETVRLYGLMKATEEGDSDAIRGAHAAYFRDRAGPVESWPLRTPWEPYVSSDNEDLQNHRAALEWYRERDDLSSLGWAAAAAVLGLGLNITDLECRFFERREVIEVLDGPDRDAYLIASATNANLRGNWHGQAQFSKSALETATLPRLRATATGLFCQMLAMEGRPVDDLVADALEGLGPGDRDLAVFVKGRLIDGPLGRGDAAGTVDLLEELAADGEFVAVTDLPKAYIILGRPDDALAAVGRAQGKWGPLGEVWEHLVRAHVLSGIDRPAAINALAAADRSLRYTYDTLIEAELLVAAAMLAYQGDDHLHAVRLLATTHQSFRTPGGYGLYAHIRDLVRDHVDRDTVAQARADAAAATPHHAWVRELDRLRSEL